MVKKDNRTEIIKCRVTPREKKEIEILARKSGLDVSKFMRLSGLSKDGVERMRDPVKRDILYEMFSKQVDSVITFNDNGEIEVKV